MSGHAIREHASSRAAGLTLRARRRVALVGQPNLGKSVVFGRLTGRHVTISNGVSAGAVVTVLQTFPGVADAILVRPMEDVR